MNRIICIALIAIAFLSAVAPANAHRGSGRVEAPPSKSR